MERRWSGFVAGAVGGGASSRCCLTRAVGNEYFFFAGYVVLQFIVLATAWNILGGYAGYVNFGSGAFFAAGAYTAVALIKAFDSAAPRADPRRRCGHRGDGIPGRRADHAAARHLLFYRHGSDRRDLRDGGASTGRIVGGARGTTVLQPAAACRLRLLHAHAVRRDDAACAVWPWRMARYIETSWIGRGCAPFATTRKRPNRWACPRCRLKLFAATRVRRTDGCGGRAVSAVHELHRAGVGVQPQLCGVGAGHADHRRHRELARPGDRRGPAGLGAADRHRDDFLGAQRAGAGALLVIFVVAAPRGILGLLPHCAPDPPLPCGRGRGEGGDRSRPRGRVASQATSERT